MNRRDLLTRGTLLTTALLLPGCCQLNSDVPKRPDPEDFDEPLLKALALALHAPSPHNTQPWKFEVVSDSELLAFVDETRLLPATDPPSRQIHLGLGCVVETFVIGATRFGHTAAVELFPDGYEAPADIGRAPVARLRLEAGGARDPLEQWIEARRTNRKPYDDEPVPRSTVEDLRAEAGAASTELRLLDSGLEPLIELLYQAFEVESRTYAANEETRRMFRFCEAELERKRDGISIPQMGTTGAIRCVAESSLDDGAEANWHSDKTIERALAGVRKGLDSARTLLVWVSPANEVADWVAAGRDYQRFSLAMTSRGLHAHPYNQIIQEYAEMDELRAAWDEALGITSPQKVQMVARIGWGDIPYVSWRRLVDDVLV